jgi:hypothetical protein
MTTRIHALTFSLPLLMAVFFGQPSPQMAQEGGREGASLKSFAGTWRGICADSKEFVVLTISQNGADLEGTVRLANMQGEDGQCSTVVDPPSAEHAMKISDARLRGTVLAFKGSQHAEFEMTLVGADGARLKFLGTPVEDTPWELKRAK